MSLVPPSHRFTVEDYEQMVDHGDFVDDRLEVHRQPRADDTYADLCSLRRGDNSEIWGMKPAVADVL